jgi:hypothetical protein
VLSPNSSATTAWFNSANVDEPIYNTSGSWYYSTGNGTFASDSSFSISCGCPGVTSCATGEFIQSGSAMFNGVFVYLNTTYNGYPVYGLDTLPYTGSLQPSLILFLYYYSNPSSCSYWVVSQQFGSASGVLYAFNTALQPQSVTNWAVNSASANSSGIVFNCDVFL